MNQILEKLYEYSFRYGLNVVAALLIFVIGRWVAKIVSKIVERVLSKTKVNATMIIFTRNISYFSVMTFVVIAVLNKIGIETTSFIAIIGAAGLAVGLALQGSLANFAAGVLVVIFQPFELGDMVEAGGAAGKVEDIQIFSTVLRFEDNKKIIVPNARITGDKIVVHPRAKK